MHPQLKSFQDHMHSCRGRAPHVASTAIGKVRQACKALPNPKPIALHAREINRRLPAHTLSPFQVETLLQPALVVGIRPPTQLADVPGPRRPISSQCRHELILILHAKLAFNLRKQAIACLASTGLQAIAHYRSKSATGQICSLRSGVSSQGLLSIAIPEVE